MNSAYNDKTFPKAPANPLLALALCLELKAPQVAYWAIINRFNAKSWLLGEKQLHIVNELILFWCLASLVERVRKIQTEGSADLTTTVWGIVQRAQLGPRFFSLIEQKIKANEDLILQVRDYLSKAKAEDFFNAIHLAEKAGHITERTRQIYEREAGLRALS